MNISVTEIKKSKIYNNKY